jgi:uncharacterized membrane protein
MEVSSELPLAAESAQSVLFAEGAEPAELHYVADEEFPQDLPVTYDWMLQPASQRASPRVLRLVAVTVAALLIIASFLLVLRPARIVPISVGLAVVLLAVAFRALLAPEVSSERVRKRNVSSARQPL